MKLNQAPSFALLSTGVAKKSHASIMKTLRLVFLLLIGGLAGCAGVEQKPDENTPTLPYRTPELSFESELFGEPPADIISVADIYQLSEMQQNAFQIYLNHPSRQDMPVHQRVYDYLESATMSFGYRGDTYTAEEAL